MISHWPIRRKLQLAVFLLVVTVVALSFSGFRGVYSYRDLVKTLSNRAAELPLAHRLAQHVSELQVTTGRLSLSHEYLNESSIEEQEPFSSRQAFYVDLENVRTALERYREQLSKNRTPDLFSTTIADIESEQETVRDIDETLDRIGNLNEDEAFIFKQVSLGQLTDELETLAEQTNRLPTFLQKRMHAIAGDVRTQYRTWIVVTWVTSLFALLLLALEARLFYAWVLRPLKVLLHGSRRVASGNFAHRIHLNSRDEMAELAEALNNMTRRFQAIRDDLDGQVRQRTKEVVRSEQLASVGFLAAGVAHEINNPLASIALCAESLEDRLHDVMEADDQLPDGEHNDEVSVLRNYLRMIQDEAFRCKQITEQLLDFSRLGDVEKHNADLREEIQLVIEMVSHLGKYKEKQIHFEPSESVIASVNVQEFKQVILNLLTNSLDSLDRGGRVTVRLAEIDSMAQIQVQDNGCGMTKEVKQNLFEPFFTRRRDGQGTGLGMSITYRIVTDHGGEISAHSDGLGTGSEVVVRLPLSKAIENKEPRHQYQAA